MEPDTNIAKTAREREEMAGKSKFDNIKTTVADKLETAASAIRQKARESEDPDRAMMGYGNRASDWLDHSASYIREMDPERVKTDIQEQVRRNPGRSLLIAGAAGLILGALLRRR